MKSLITSGVGYRKWNSTGQAERAILWDKIKISMRLLITGGAGFTPWNGAQFHRASRNNNDIGLNKD